MTAQFQQLIGQSMIEPPTTIALAAAAVYMGGAQLFAQSGTPEIGVAGLEKLGNSAFIIACLFIALKFMSNQASKSQDKITLLYDGQIADLKKDKERLEDKVSGLESKIMTILSEESK